jgi:hypothetical protein
VERPGQILHRNTQITTIIVHITLHNNIISNNQAYPIIHYITLECIIKGWILTKVVATTRDHRREAMTQFMLNQTFNIIITNIIILNSNLPLTKCNSTTSNSKTLVPQLEGSVKPLHLSATTTTTRNRQVKKAKLQEARVIS